jgi:hypothetical protein
MTWHTEDLACVTWHTEDLACVTWHTEDVACVTWCMACAQEVYVWPHVRELKERRVSHDVLPPAHRRVMAALLDGYSGMCNVNYKLRGDELCIFEVNTRVGGDLAMDAPPGLARTLFEALDRRGDTCQDEEPRT